MRANAHTKVNKAIKEAIKEIKSCHRKGHYEIYGVPFDSAEIGQTAKEQVVAMRAEVARCVIFRTALEVIAKGDVENPGALAHNALYVDQIEPGHPD